MHMQLSDLYRKYGPGQILPRQKVPIMSQAAEPSKPTEKYQNVVLAAERANVSESDLLSFRFILTTAGANNNNQYFVEDEIARAEVYKTPIDQAIDQDHLQTFEAICGEIYDSEYLPGHVLIEGARVGAIRCYGWVFAKQYPEVAFKVEQGAGKWAAVSMEAWPNPLEKVGKYTVIHDPEFIGAGLVRFPGNAYAKIDRISDRAILREHSQQARAIFEGIRILTGNTRNCQ